VGILLCVKSHTSGEDTLFGVMLPAELEQFVWDANPWWRGAPMRPLPRYRRWLFPTVLKRLQSPLAPVVALRGARQVGKTTLQLQIIEHLLREGVAPQRLFRVQFDELPTLKGFQQPILTLCRWFQSRVLQGSFNEWAQRGEPVYIFLDEVQNLPDWSAQVKALVDHHAVRVLLTGSSALRIEYGRESLAGRITTVELGPLLLREIAELTGIGAIPSLAPENGLDALRQQAFWQELREAGQRHAPIRDQAFEVYAERGGYPFAYAQPLPDWETLAEHLNETIIRRVLQHDLRVGERGRRRDPVLLEMLFRLACRYAGQAPSPTHYLRELQETTQANIGWQRALAYLRFLNDSLLIRLIEPLEIRLKRRKSQPKVCLCDHSLRASWLREIVPLTPNALREQPDQASLAGHLAESIVGFFLSGIPNLNLNWYPERGVEPEVDFVLTVGDYRIPIEVKYRQRIDPHRDTLGLRAFLEKTANNAPFGVLITLQDGAEIPDPRIVALPLSTLLLMR
jgi:predicted AAA+ superfamily ATPase